MLGEWPIHLTDCFLKMMSTRRNLEDDEASGPGSSGRNDRDHRRQVRGHVVSQEAQDIHGSNLSTHLKLFINKFRKGTTMRPD